VFDILLHGLRVQPAPVLIESVKDGIEDSLHALNVVEQDHGPGAPADFHEATLDGVGGAQLAPQRLREIEEGQAARVNRAPAAALSRNIALANESESARRRGGPGRHRGSDRCAGHRV
jgi:hypothetical protein